MSSKRCTTCEQPIKLKHIKVASKNGHEPPALCYACLRRTKKKKTSRQRKVELAKKRQRERDKLKRGIASS
jgi:hypothetical protein